jgi:hypothetical protein
MTFARPVWEFVQPPVFEIAAPEKQGSPQAWQIFVDVGKLELFKWP